MANETRIRANFMNGFVDDDPFTIGAGTFTSSALANFPVVDSRQHAAITIDPASQFGAPEIIWIINHPAAAITATVLRGRENTTPRQHNQGVRWSHAPTTWDHDRPKSAAIRVYAKSMWR